MKHLPSSFRCVWCHFYSENNEYACHGSYESTRHIVRFFLSSRYSLILQFSNQSREQCIEHLGILENFLAFCTISIKKSIMCVFPLSFTLLTSALHLTSKECVNLSSNAVPLCRHNCPWSPNNWSVPFSETPDMIIHWTAGQSFSNRSSAFRLNRGGSKSWSGMSESAPKPVKRTTCS